MSKTMAETILAVLFAIFATACLAAQVQSKNQCAIIHIVKRVVNLAYGFTRQEEVSRV